VSGRLIVRDMERILVGCAKVDELEILGEKSRNPQVYEQEALLGMKIAKWEPVQTP
jgi:hypothetical protein